MFVLRVLLMAMGMAIVMAMVARGSVEGSPNPCGRNLLQLDSCNALDANAPTVARV